MVSHLGLSGSTSSVDGYLTSAGGAGAWAQKNGQGLGWAGWQDCRLFAAHPGIFHSATCCALRVVMPRPILTCWEGAC